MFAYLQSSTLGISLLNPLQLPAILAFLQVFLFTNRLVLLHSKAEALNSFSSRVEQEKYSSNFCFRLFILTLILSLFIETVFMNKLVCFLIFGFTWLPQIFKTAIRGSTHQVSCLYALVQSAHALFLPLYIRGYEHNFAKIKPDLWFSGLLLTTVAV